MNTVPVKYFGHLTEIVSHKETEEQSWTLNNFEKQKMICIFVYYIIFILPCDFILVFR